MVDRKVSIIIPCYNGARFLAETLESALRQTEPAREIVVVDDGSKDASAEIAEATPGVRCVRQPNRGVSAARNHGLRETSGEYVIFLDADDRLMPDAVGVGRRSLDENFDCGFVYGFARDIDVSGRVTGTHSANVSDARYQTLLEGNTLVPSASAMFRRRALESVGGFDEGIRLAQDHELYLRVAREHHIRSHNMLVVEYRLHEKNASRQSPTTMLNAVLHTIDLQEPWLRPGAELRDAARRGRAHFRRLFAPLIMAEMMDNLRAGNLKRSARAGMALLRHSPEEIVRHAEQRAARTLRWLLA
jgi:glycosyltransferase involved in cell wall biosynthesis